MVVWAGLVAGAGTQLGNAAAHRRPKRSPHPKPLELSQYEPKSMLQVHESHVARAKFPVIDYPHPHFGVDEARKTVWNFPPDRQYLGTPQELLAVMDRKNIRAMVNLTGGYDKGPGRDTLRNMTAQYPGPFLHLD